MPKADVTGTVTAFLHSKFKQDNYRTVVELAKPQEAGKLVGARVSWSREGGPTILGRVVGPHGRKGALRVRWDRGVPPQALGTKVTITK